MFGCLLTVCDDNGNTTKTDFFITSTLCSYLTMFLETQQQYENECDTLCIEPVPRHSCCIHCLVNLRILYAVCIFLYL